MATVSPHWKIALPILGLAACAALVATAAPAQAAAEGKPRAVRVAAIDAPYALVRAENGRFDISGSSDDWDAVRAAQRAINGEFIWFREGGQSYVIEDATTVAKARTAWKPLDRLGAQMKVHGKEMERHGKKMEGLQQDMQRATVNLKYLPDARDSRSINKGMQALGREMEALARQMEAARDDAERERIGRRMDELGERMDDAGKRIDAAYRSPQIRQAHASTEAIGEQMRDAGKPVEALGTQMGALGKDMERESKAADKTVRALIQEARAKGLARLAPTAS